MQKKRVAIAARLDKLFCICIYGGYDGPPLFRLLIWWIGVVPDLHIGEYQCQGIQSSDRRTLALATH